MGNPAVSADEQAALDDALVRMVAACNLPFTIVEQPSFTVCWLFPSSWFSLFFSYVHRTSASCYVAVATTCPQGISCLTSSFPNCTKKKRGSSWQQSPASRVPCKWMAGRMYGQVNSHFICEVHGTTQLWDGAFGAKGRRTFLTFKIHWALPIAL